MKTKQLKLLAHDFIQTRLMIPQIVIMDEVVDHVIAQQGEIKGPGAVFHRFCAREVVYELSKSVLDKYTPREELGEHLYLQGFSEFMSGYTVRRNGARCCVPSQLMTANELRARIQEYKAIASTTNRHARELEIFLEMRLNQGLKDELPE